MMAYDPFSLELLIGGEPVGGETIPVAGPPVASGEATFDLLLDADGWAAFCADLLYRTRGASIWTLWRRSKYGGRKGRRAMRRLRAMGVL